MLLRVWYEPLCDAVFHARNRKHDVFFVIHDVDWTQSESICLDRFTMSGSRLARAVIEHVAFDNCAIGYSRLQSFDQSIGSRFGPCGSPLCSLIATLPVMFSLTWE